jgi:hypothetical protein
MNPYKYGVVAQNAAGVKFDDFCRNIQMHDAKENQFSLLNNASESQIWQWGVKPKILREAT